MQDTSVLAARLLSLATEVDRVEDYLLASDFVYDIQTNTVPFIGFVRVL